MSDWKARPTSDNHASHAAIEWNKRRVVGSIMFVDRVEIFVKGGDGGRGMCSFRREKYVPRGGPDGGDGGDGGSVIIRAVAGTDSLAEIVNRKFWRARRGGAGGSANCHGRRAE